MNEQAQQHNHPTVIRWNIKDDYYQDGMVLYADGLLEINVGGFVYGMSLRNWFESVKELESERKRLEKLIHSLRTLWCDAMRNPETGYLNIEYLDKFQKILADNQGTAGDDK